MITNSDKILRLTSEQAFDNDVRFKSLPGHFILVKFKSASKLLPDDVAGCSSPPRVPGTCHVYRRALTAAVYRQVEVSRQAGNSQAYSATALRSEPLPRRSSRALHTVLCDLGRGDGLGS